jgi:rhodanese-related sulfurtransferase
MDANQDISVEELKALLEGGEKIHFYDVRNPDEFEEDNLGAILIPLGDLSERIDEFDGLQSEHIYVHCRSGARSARAKQILESNGFENVHNVLGGIMAFRNLG